MKYSIFVVLCFCFSVFAQETLNESIYKIYAAPNGVLASVYNFWENRAFYANGARLNFGIILNPDEKTSENFIRDLKKTIDEAFLDFHNSKQIKNIPELPQYQSSKATLFTSIQDIVGDDGEEEHFWAIQKLNIHCQDSLFEMDAENVSLKRYTREGILIQYSIANSQISLLNSSSKYEKKIVKPSFSDQVSTPIDFLTSTVKRDTSFKRSPDLGEDILNLNWDIYNISKPTLWLLSVGVSEYASVKQNIKFADADALSFADAFKTQESILYREVFTEILLNKQVARSTLFEKFDSFLGQATSDDVVMIFIAGHGIKHSQTDSYYFLPHDATPENILDKGFRNSDFAECIKILQKNVYKIILFFDTCHGGAMRLDGRGSTAGADLASDWEQSEGVYIFSASKEGEKAREYEQQGHGAFTYSIIKAIIDGSGDLDRDGIIMLSELFKYVSQQVPRMTKGAQHPYQRWSGTDIPIFKYK